MHMDILYGATSELVGRQSYLEGVYEIMAPEKRIWKNVTLFIFSVKLLKTFENN